ncbi:MAG TPA: hypothetical protein VMN57_07100 [Anaerolineales bacterium]|nr:hypothetical protein [Anaerolineales bacterium]
MANLNPKDTEALSAFLDGNLDPVEHARLEQRLRQETVLQAELESLDRTRRMLRAAPHYRAPRNFTLTPEMAGIPAARPGVLSGLTRIAFQMTSILFIVALVGNFTFQGLGGSQPDNPAAFTSETDGEMPPEADPAAEDAAGESSAAGAEEPAEEQTMEMLDAESVESGEDPEEIQALAAPSEESLSVAEEAESQPVEDPVAEGEITAVPDAAEGDRQPLESTGPEEPEIAAIPQEADRKVAAADPAPINPWSIFTVLTGAAALLSGFLALLLRRR